MTIEVGRVQALWRYPVKSMQGEALTRAEVEARGLVGDRLFAIRDTEASSAAARTHGVSAAWRGCSILPREAMAIGR